MGKYTNHEDLGANAPLNWRENTQPELYLEGMSTIAPPGMKLKAERVNRFKAKIDQPHSKTDAFRGNVRPYPEEEIMEKWEAEIKDMLAKQNWEPLDWEDFFKQVMPILHLMMTMAVGGMTVHGPEGRNELRKHLLEAGCPKEMVEQAIYWVIEHGTRSWEETNGRTGYSND